jgi:hypothetical protein
MVQTVGADAAVSDPTFSVRMAACCEALPVIFAEGTGEEALANLSQAFFRSESADEGFVTETFTAAILHTPPLSTYASAVYAAVCYNTICVPHLYGRALELVAVALTRASADDDRLLHAPGAKDRGSSERFDVPTPALNSSGACAALAGAVHIVPRAIVRGGNGVSGLISSVSVACAHCCCHGQPMLAPTLFTSITAPPISEPDAVSAVHFLASALVSCLWPSSLAALQPRFTQATRKAIVNLFKSMLAFAHSCEQSSAHPLLQSFETFLQHLLLRCLDKAEARTFAAELFRDICVASSRWVYECRFSLKCICVTFWFKGYS